VKREPSKSEELPNFGHNRTLAGSTQRNKRKNETFPGAVTEKKPLKVSGRGQTVCGHGC